MLAEITDFYIGTDSHRSISWFGLASENLEEGRLTGGVRSDESDALPPATFAAILDSGMETVTRGISERKIRAIATLHPAYLLRQPLQKRLAWRDFLQLRDALAVN